MDWYLVFWGGINYFGITSYFFNNESIFFKIEFRPSELISLSEKTSLALELKQGDYVRLSITDSGCGMDETVIEQIFDPFYSTKGDKGTGLGLSQVFGFVKRAGGTIKVFSEPDEGSTFDLYFPRYLNTDIAPKIFI